MYTVYLQEAFIMKITRIAALILALVCLCMPACAAQTTLALGNEIAGYLTTDDLFYNFTSINITQEQSEEMFNSIGYCQYMCMSESPLSGVLLTMNGMRPSQFPEGSTLQDHINALANAALASFAPDFTDPTYTATAIEIDESRAVSLLYIYETENMEQGIFVALCYATGGNYGVYYLENVPLTEDALGAMETLLTTFVPGTK